MEQNVMTVCAHPSKRYKAVLVDSLIIGVLFMPVVIYSYIERLIINEQYVLIFYLFIYKVIIYLIFDFVIPFLNDGKTIGRASQKIRLVQSNGQEATFIHYTKRASLFLVLATLGDVFFFVTFVYVVWTVILVASILLILIHEFRKSIHDFIAGTMVINEIQYYIEEEA